MLMLTAAVWRTLNQSGVSARVAWYSCSVLGSTPTPCAMLLLRHVPSVLKSSAGAAEACCRKAALSVLKGLGHQAASRPWTSSAPGLDSLKLMSTLSTRAQDGKACCFVSGALDFLGGIIHLLTQSWDVCYLRFFRSCSHSSQLCNAGTRCVCLASSTGVPSPAQLQHMRMRPICGRFAAVDTFTGEPYSPLVHWEAAAAVAISTSYYCMRSIAHSFWYELLHTATDVTACCLPAMATA